ncbi:hypothetical protein [Methylobacterium sp. Leaf465]|jgi:hypothetical protein|nr:hypothetical protein [Methylobacterium sp. Leaf465]
MAQGRRLSFERKPEGILTGYLPGIQQSEELPDAQVGRGGHDPA